MKGIYYPKLAWLGIKRNKQVYVPFMLTGIGMVMMYYIITYLEGSDALYQMSGGRQLQATLGFGVNVMAFFCVIFLFYTNSFLIRRRKKEFGLYNILGMGKWNIARMLVWESLIMYVIAVLGGLLSGVLFSKLAELAATRMIGLAPTYQFSVSLKAVRRVLFLFAVVFGLILINNLRSIHVSKPVELLRSENVGEKPPKVNWVLALLGVLVLGAAYVLAVSIKEPLQAMVWFFVAVMMVIAATYALFISGSVALCKLLQKNKKFYYRTNHFVSVSSMSYRMKRNGAGLASICILSTMVLVTISSTACLYFGKEDGMRIRYPEDIVLKTYTLDENAVGALQALAWNVVSDAGEQIEGEVFYRYLDVIAERREDFIATNDITLGFSMGTTSTQIDFYIVPLEDYNRLTGEQEELAPGEVLLGVSRGSDYSYDTITLEDWEPLRVKRVVRTLPPNGADNADIFASYWLFVPDFERYAAFYQGERLESLPVSTYSYYGFNLSADDKAQRLIVSAICERIGRAQIEDEAFPHVWVESIAEEREGFYGMYGSLFFLGILLGIVFVFATVLIIYYKQISEGYEDRAKFEIMQKVGMTEREIKKSVNSQVLTVFFLPLITAGIHTAFAFPLIQKIMLLFNAVNISLLIWTTIACFLIFGFFYIIVYRMTSRAYLKLVS
ncbi:MAG: ABC transporter permease [Lachnospiraceae bacterium]|nr:ABC transporter permease [Lachnospiraceae bacterium]